MGRFLDTLRSLFLGRDRAEPARRAPGATVDAEHAMTVPADSQEIVSMARDFRAFLDQQDQRQQRNKYFFHGDDDSCERETSTEKPNDS